QFRQVQLGQGVIQIARVHQRAALFLQCTHKRRVTMAEHIDGYTSYEVEIAFPGVIPYIATFAAHQCERVSLEGRHIDAVLTLRDGFLTILSDSGHHATPSMIVALLVVPDKIAGRTPRSRPS